VVIHNNPGLHRYELFVAGDLIRFVQYGMRHEEMWVLFMQLRRKFKSVATVNRARGR
jgi:hypothetical protein